MLEVDMANSADFRVTIHYSQQGQARPHADSIYCARLSVEQYRGGKWIPSDSTDETVKAYTQLVRPWKHEGSPYNQESFGETFAPHLTKFEKVSAGVWEVSVTEIFTD
jgi:hypothetical protein